jgi:hypothetical protein
VIPLAAVCPELPSAQVCDAWVGVTTLLFAEHPLKFSCWAVFTCNVNGVDAGLPEAGVATMLPAKAPEVPLVVTVTVPQFAVFAAHVAGPGLTLMVLSVDAYWMALADVCPLLPTTQVSLAVAGITVGEFALQFVKVSDVGVSTIRLKAADAGAPPSPAVAVSVPK